MRKKTYRSCEMKSSNIFDQNYEKPNFSKNTLFSSKTAKIAQIWAFWLFLMKIGYCLKNLVFRIFVQKWYLTSSLRICKFFSQMVNLLEPKKHLICLIRPKNQLEKKNLKRNNTKNDPVQRKWYCGPKILKSVTAEVKFWSKNLKIYCSGSAVAVQKF